jgi:L-amino acid N-acyltransferase YncA
VKLRAATLADAAEIAAIYAPYVTDSIVSFEAEPPSASEVAARMDAAGDLYPWIVAADGDGDGAIAGYAYASPFRARAAYRYAVETSIYLAAGAHGHGTGQLLYGSLLDTLVAQGFVQAIGAITLPNPASVRLHRKLGFEEAGTYREVGWKMGAWHSVSLWQRALAPATIPPAEPKAIGMVGLRLA